MSVKSLRSQLLLLTFALSLGACQNQAHLEWKTYTVVAQDLSLSVKDTGELAAQQDQILRVPFDGTLIQLIPEGQEVKKGDLLGKLETSAQVDERNAAQLSLKSAQLDLEITQLSQKIQTEQLQHDLQLASLDLKLENLRLRRLKEERDPVKAVQLKASATALKQNLEILELEARERARLFELGYLSEQERDQAQQQLTESRKEQERLQAEQKVFTQGPRSEDLQKQALRVGKMQEQLNLFKQQAKVQKEVSQVKAKTATASIKKYQERLKYYQALIAKGSILAPAAGTVLYGKIKAGQEEIAVKAGDGVKEGAGVLRVIDLKQPLIRMTIHEIDAPRVKLGQSAEVRLDAYPELLLTGKVSRLLPIAAQILSNDQLELQGFAGEILLDQADQRLRPGMTASVEIMTERFQQVITVPSQAVQIAENGSTYGWVLVDGKPQKRVLQLGSSDARFTQVLSGLALDEIVILNPEAIT